MKAARKKEKDSGSKLFKQVEAPWGLPTCDLQPIASGFFTQPHMALFPVVVFNFRFACAIWFPLGLEMLVV